jgi:hypothetical protein
MIEGAQGMRVGQGEQMTGKMLKPAQGLKAPSDLPSRTISRQ